MTEKNKTQGTAAGGSVASADLFSRWCPDRCPITRLPFFMWIEHPQMGWVPTYGGPYDSYTIPEMEGEPDELWHDRELTRERYDHDDGAWVDGCETIGMRIVSEEELDRRGFWENVEDTREAGKHRKRKTTND